MCKLIKCCLLLFILLFHSGFAQVTGTPLSSPYKNLDTLATNDWWSRTPNEIINLKVNRDSVVAFGLYTVHANVLKLTAQLYPLYPNETRTISLALFKDEKWNTVQKQNVNELGWSALFRIENWDDSEDTKYRINHGEGAYFEGTIRKNPVHKNEIVMAALSCNSNKDRGLRENYVRNINYQDPDILFFAGDQSYDHTEHTAAWLNSDFNSGKLSETGPVLPFLMTTILGRATFGEKMVNYLQPKEAAMVGIDITPNM